MAEVSKDDIKFIFQEKVLKEHGDFLKDLFQESIKEKKLIVTGELLNSIDFDVIKKGDNYELNFSFYDYGRFIEINRNKRKRASKFDSNTNRDIWGIKENTMKRRRLTDWYTRNAYGALNRLIGVLMYEFTDEEVARIKKQISKKINITI